MSIILSKKHGLNPALEVCFWCGKEMGVAICGRMKGDAEAPRRMVCSLEPCPECKKAFEKGVHIIEVAADGERFGNDKAFSIKDENGNFMYPTGRHAVFNPEAIRNGKPGMTMLSDKETMDAIAANVGKAGEQDASRG